MATSHHHHPAHKLYLFTIVFLAITVLFGFIAVFVPWAMKDLAVGSRAWAYPFKTCVEDTFSWTNLETCQDNDFMSNGRGVGVTGGSATCQAFILATIAFVFISVLGGVLVLLSLIWLMDQMWTRPVCVATVAQGGLVLVCLACFVSWIMFICYAENTCAPNSIFPVRGYSYGFVLYIFATATSIGSVVTGHMGLKALKTFVPPKDSEPEEEHQGATPVYPTYDPEVPFAQPTPPTPDQQYH